MAEVSSVTSATGTAAQAARGSSRAPAADYDTFLTLLVTQMKNQDPLNPTDNTEYIAQLASFSAVEQQTQTNDKLDLILSYMSIDQASSLIGKHIVSADGETSGVIESVKLTDSSLVATLASGEEVTITSGIRIAETAPAS